PHQLALDTPGISPRFTTSRIFTRDSPNLRYTPRERPVIAQRLRPREALASRGCCCSFVCAATRCSGVLRGLRMISFSCARFAAYFFTIPARRFSRSTMLVLAIRSLVSCCTSGRLFPEREVESFEQRAPLLVVARRRRDGDVHAPDRVDLVVLDLGENDLFLHTQAVVATSVDRTGRHATEVADAGHRDADQASQDLAHPAPT